MYSTSIYYKIEKMFSFVILIFEEILHFCIDCMKVTNWGGESNAKILRPGEIVCKTLLECTEHCNLRSS